MRDIKFRSWHKKYKKYYEVHHLHVGAIGIHEGIWATCKAYDCIEQKDIYIQIQPNDCIIEQFTGLHDKNGKEIYEGDIVRANGMSNTHSLDSYINKDLPNRNTRVVTWVENGWALVEPVLDCVTQGITLKTGTQKRFEVIGNIHENKE